MPPRPEKLVHRTTGHSVPERARASYRLKSQKECELQRERRAAARAAEAEKKAQQEQERTRRNSIIRTIISISEARGSLARTSGAALLS